MEFLTDVVSSVVGKFGEYTVALVVRQLGYFFNHKKNISNLESQIRKLVEEREKLQVLVTKAEAKGYEIAKNVRDWQNKTCDTIEKSEKFINEEGHTSTRCSGYGPFPNLILRRRLSRKAEKMAQDAKNEIEEGQKINQNEPAISYPVILPPPVENTKSQESFKSRISTLTEIMEALRDPNVSRIGVYGMAGVGKTTLAKEVEQEVLKDQLFDVVVMVPVSQTPNFFEIQQIIADNLGLKLREKTVPTRAKRLHDQLMKQEKKILIILDDVWTKLELQDVGLIEKGFKMVLTSRSQSLCVQMDANKNFQVGILNEDEALTLFDRINGDTAKREDLQDLVPKIVKECAGLPLAITTVASALKAKSRAAWEDVLRELRRSSPTDIDGMGKVHSSIKKSYYYLDSDNMRSLLVFCSLHKDDAEIHIDQLLRYGSGFGLFQGVTKLEEARNKVFNLVENLKAASLLLGGRSSLFVKLHDVVRDVVISIAANDERMYLVKDVLELKQYGSQFKDPLAISLFYNNIDGPPTALACPQLKLFLMFGSGSSAQISGNLIFEETSALTVLLLTSVNIERLQSCFPVLENLGTLCLNGCKLKDIASIGELKQLKILDLAGSEIEELPKEIGQLRSLKLLDLSFCDQLRIIQPNVISSLTNLEELNMRESFTSWEADQDDGDRSNASLFELSNLLKLSALYIEVENSGILPRNKWLSDKLERYHIIIADGFYSWLVPDGVSRILDVRLDRSSQLDEYEIRALLKASDHLSLYGLVGIHDVVRGLDKDGFPQLKHLIFRCNDEIRSIVNLLDNNYTPVFPKLESLHLDGLGNLESICQGIPVTASFSKLIAVSVSTCNELKNLLPFSIAGRLEKIFLYNCPRMEEIVACGGEDDASDNNKNNATSDGKIEFPQLRSLYLHDLPELKQFCSGLKMTSTLKKTEEPTTTDTTSIPLFNQKIAFPNLESLQITFVNSKKIWDYPSTTSGSFCKSATLDISRCHNLKNILSSRMLASVVPNLTSMTIWDCKMVEEVFEIERSSVEQTGDAIATQLRFLSLRDLPKLEHVWNKDPRGSLVFQNLKEIHVFLCPNLENLFPASVAKSLLQLETLIIEYCDLLKEIVVNYKDEGTTTFVFPKLTSLGLRNLPELVSFYAEQCTSECTTETVNNPIQQPLFLPEKVEFPSLRSITISELSNRTLWSEDLQGALAFQNLREIDVYKCPNLTSLFPPSVAEDLLQLETLHIRDCELLEVIVGRCKEEEEEGTMLERLPKPVFPKLKLLKLRDLPELVSFFGSACMTARMDCPIQQTFYLIDQKVEFPSLRTINISGLSNLKKIFPPSILTTPIPNLTELEIENCDMLEETCNGKNLAELTIWGCGNLKSLVPSTVSLQNLTSLIVSECHGMVNLATAKSLGHVLRRMSIFDCQGMIEIIAGDHTETQEELVFSELETLALHNLPCLTCFYSGNCIMKFPNLKTVIVSECFEMQRFCIQEAMTQNLDKIITGFRSDCFDHWYSLNYHFQELQDPNTFERTLWEGNINTTLLVLWGTAKDRTKKNLKDDLEHNSKEDFENGPEDDSISNSKEVHGNDSKEEFDSNSEETSTEGSKNNIEGALEEDYENDLESDKNVSEEDSESSSEKESKKNLEKDYEEQYDFKNNSEEDSSGSIEEESEKSSEKDLTELDSKNDSEEDSEKDFQVSSSEANAKENFEVDYAKELKEKSEKDSSEDTDEDSSNSKQNSEDS